MKRNFCPNRVAMGHRFHPTNEEFITPNEEDELMELPAGPDCAFHPTNEELITTQNGEDELRRLPPGYRFHPTDEELITHYLTPKVVDSNFSAKAIVVVDLNNVEPWDLPGKAKMGEKERYFFCARDRKYSTGLRTNRATKAGYWKSTGKDREIKNKGKQLVGMKKTLVFHKGRAPKGEKTNWVMHEFRLEGNKYSLYNLPKSTKNDWVISRVFQKRLDGKMELWDSATTTDYGNQSGLSNLPPQIDSSHVPCFSNSRSSNLPPQIDSSQVLCFSNSRSSNLPPQIDSSHVPCFSNSRSSNLPPQIDSSHVTCFSNSMEYHKSQEHIIDSFNTSLLVSSSSDKPFDTSSTSLDFPLFSAENSLSSSQFLLNHENSQYSDTFKIQDESILRILSENIGSNMKENPKTEFSQDTGMSPDLSPLVSKHRVGQRCYEVPDDPFDSPGAVDFDSIWN